MAQLWLLFLLPALMGSVTANKPPKFTSNITNPVVLPEDLPVGAEAFWLYAEDEDHDALTYAISGKDSTFFSVNPSTGEVKVASSLDYETDYFLSFEVSVRDPYNAPVVATVMILLEDRNDNIPVFQDTSLSTSINETLPVGSVVFSVLAEDKDSGTGGTVEYFIEKVTPNSVENQHLFRILDNGSIILNGSLSYNNKSSFYQLELKACDLGGLLNGKNITQCSQPVYLSISVVDQADLDPQFVRDFYSASVSEDAALGTSVLAVEAVDGDRGVKDPVIYSISNSTKSGWFEIKTEGGVGVIRVNDTLDREQLLQEDEEVQVQVTATEEHLNIYGQEAKASVWVTIRVTDVNDHKPEFYNCSLESCSFTADEAQDSFTGWVEEHAASRIPIEGLTMAAYDPDKGRNGTFELFLEGPDAPAFSVSPTRAAGSADVQVLVRDSEMVDYENKTVMMVQVVATDVVSKNSSVASVTIHLRDVNDHRPTFPKNLYIFEVPEHSPPGFVVTNTTLATDPDTGEWGHITYSLLPGNGVDLFEVDPDTGTVTVRDSLNLDREQQTVYFLTLQATDGGNQASTTTLEIHLLDINDNAPEVMGSYNVFVQEGRGNVSLTILAQDKDQPGTNNSLLIFTLLPGPYSHNFSLDPSTGFLTNLGPLDREAIDPALEGRIVLGVRVSDCGVPPQSTEVNVTITVEDINDNEPIFNQSSYQFPVAEQEPGIWVGTVEAWDADQTEANNRISFSLSGSGANNFLLQSSMLGSGRAEGRLRLPPDVSLDYETQNFFQLTVHAENPGPQGPEATADVQVIVEDVNDEPPTLVAASLREISVAENGSQHGQVAEIQAQDVDTGARLVIELVDVICTKAGLDVGSLCRGWFSVEANGSVYINQSEAIDFETCDRVMLVVRACDLDTDPRFQAYSDNGTLGITIKDVNDNAPYFLLDNKTFVIIPELVIPDQQVAYVQARDEDSGANANIKFSLLRVDFVSKDGTTTPFNNYFQISTTSEAGVFTGSIQLVTSLDSTLQGTYQVTVQARDHVLDNVTHKTQITLNLFTVDQSYRVRLQFSTSKDEVGANVEDIKAALAQATRTSVYVVDIQNINPAARAQAVSYLDAYFVFPNGTALALDQLSVMIRRDQDSLTQLLNMGLVVLGSQESQESSQPQVLSSAIIGLAVALVLVLLIMSVALVCVRKSYHRKLRAMEAGKEARRTAVGTAVPPGPPSPGTNVYNAERANPMLDLPAKDLEYVSSASDQDYVSLNSLDENSVDVNRDSQDTKKEPGHSPPGPDLEPLSVVLADRKMGAEGPGREVLSFTNASLDTTDL
ncbi:LOW QUALITY PROTEIN: cadherin-related family member 2 [Dipodomys spectabilis]|uniref:LOW QUALITY PROTEIN: cadherin-related family member 2 n=1 Tax=Dipodomys spectabilis TaxID=105255 RepID=UPI001C537E33|nr:LOW QUALITY PROTEIN: cadherin-related family member 2 [Dipodomys spectabilis]